MENNPQFLIEILKRKGFRDIYEERTDDKLNFTFDVFAEKADEAVGFEFRKNENIPDYLFERLSAITKYHKKLNIFLIFERKPSKLLIYRCGKLGLGLLIRHYDKFIKILESKDFSTRKNYFVKKKIKRSKQIQQIWIFPSSKQDCKERRILLSKIEKIRNRHDACVFSLKVEKEREKNFRKCILQNLKKADIFVGIITSDYRVWVDFEIHKVFDYVTDDNLILILKKNEKIDPISIDEMKRIRKIKEKTKDLISPKIPENFTKDIVKISPINQDLVKKFNYIELVRFIESRIKHIPYNSYGELEGLLENNLIKMISLLHKKKRVKSPFEFELN